MAPIWLSFSAIVVILIGYQHQASCNLSPVHSHHQNIQLNESNCDQDFISATTKSQLDVVACEINQTEVDLIKQREAKLRYLSSTEMYGLIVRNISSLSDEFSLSDIHFAVLATHIDAYEFSILRLHRYETIQEERLSTGPKIDQELCLKQLRELNRATKTIETIDKFNSKDLNTFKLLETFGRPDPGPLYGSVLWEGSYRQCLNTHITTSAGDGSQTRYCIASLKHNSWPTEPKYDLESIRMGVCLPKACDSMDYENKYELIMKLAEFNLRPLDRGQMQLTNLYCLPDEESVSRSVWHSPIASRVLAALGCWFMFILYATVKHNKLKKALKNETDPTKRMRKESQLKLLSYLSFTENLGKLVDVSTHPEEKNNEALVNFNVFGGLKVVALWLVIMAHTLMVLGADSDDLQMIGTDKIVIGGLIQGFMVNTFFVATGIYMSYQYAKQNQDKPPFGLVQWCSFVWSRFVRRYVLHALPLYYLVALYTKTLAKYTNSGPIWDYGTSALSHRRNCEQESWFWILSLGANFKPPLKHCIPSAWYLANDLHFFLVSPIFLAALHKGPKFGKRLLVGATIAGYLAGFFNIIFAEVEDLRPLATFLPNGFKTYIAYLSHNYTQPHIRIPAYLCGLYIGYVLFDYERKKLQVASATSTENNTTGTDNTEWPKKYKNHVFALCIFILVGVLSTPSFGKHLKLGKATARFLVACIIPTYHLIIGLAVGLYVLVSSTGHGNKFLDGLLSSNLWRPFARLSLCASLINIEVILYLVQGRDRIPAITGFYVLSFSILTIALVYLLATIVHVFIEVPMSALLTSFKMLISNRMAMVGKKNV